MKNTSKTPVEKKKKYTTTDWIVGLTLLIFFLVAEGWVLATVWNWFVPGIFGIPTINTLQGMALMIVGDLLFKDVVLDLTYFGPKFRQAYIKKAFLKTLTALLLGWVLKTLIGML